MTSIAETAGPELTSGVNPTLKLTPDEFRRFQSLIHKKTGIYLRDIKGDMLSGRLMRRLRALNLGSFQEYYEFLKREGEASPEFGRMINAVTTNMTSFFRESRHFDFLRALLKTRLGEGQRRFRLWCAASSTGEEPYSIAMTAAEALRLAACRADVRILATDIDTDVLEHATSGTYRETDLKSVPADFRGRYFLRGRGSDAGMVQVRNELREMIAFRHLNLNEQPWPFRGPFDMIFCRNVLIYFNDQTQQALIKRLIDLLTPDGHLFVGHSESLNWAHNLLIPVCHAGYRRRDRL